MHGIESSTHGCNVADQAWELGNVDSYSNLPVVYLWWNCWQHCFCAAVGFH